MLAIQSPGRGHGQPRSLEEAKRLVLAWQESRQSMTSWCREQGMLRSTMHSYLRRAKASSRGPSEPAFIQLTPRVEPTPVSESIWLRLGDSGATAELSVSGLALLLQTLAGRPS